MLEKLKALDQKKGDEKEKAVDDLREVVLPKELTVTGIFETGQYLHDSEFLLVPLFIGQELYGLGERSTASRSGPSIPTTWIG